jgi:MFS family permease
MKKLAFVVAAVSLFAFAPLSLRFGPVASSVALVWLGVLVAVLASGTVQSLGIAAGALGAFAGGVLSSVSPAIAGAVLIAAAFAERTTRVRSRTARAVHVLLALVGGAMAGGLANAYTTASIGVFAVAAVVAGVLAALPLLVDADDPLAHALEEAAQLLPEPAKRSLIEGADLRRNAGEIPLDRATAAKVKTTWQSLLRLAEARLRLERTRPRVRVVEPPAEAAAEGPPTAADAVLSMVDQRIAEHVNVLARAYTAVDTVTAARLGIDDSALKHVESASESLDEVSRALVEVR